MLVELRCNKMLMHYKFEQEQNIKKYQFRYDRNRLETPIKKFLLVNL